MIGVKQTTKPMSILAFDFETLATGFADPAWVPQVPTVISFSWLGTDDVHTLAVCDYSSNQMPHIQKKALRAMLYDFLWQYDKADAVTFHNGRRFDQPVLNGACWWTGMRKLDPKLTFDTIDLGKVKGVKKGQDNIGILLGVPVHKLSLNHEEWVDAYSQPGWPVVKERCASDVVQHKLIRAEMEARGWLAAPKLWKP